VPGMLCTAILQLRQYYLANLPNFRNFAGVMFYCSIFKTVVL